MILFCQFKAAQVVAILVLLPHTCVCSELFEFKAYVLEAIHRFFFFLKVSFLYIGKEKV